MSAGVRRLDLPLLLILLGALVLRLHLAGTTAYIHDENGTAIPLSQTISLAWDRLNLPLRGENHGALPAYVVKASSTLFGTTQLAYRALHVLLGLATVALLARLTRQWYGPVAARWTAALLAFNEYYLTVGSRATAHVPHLFFVAVALYAFSRFLSVQRPAHLYGAAASVGLAFYCKEHSALLLPVFGLALLRVKYRPWLRSPHVYLACATFVLAIAPDVLWNVRTDPETARVGYGERPVAQSTYRSHLARIGGLGLSPYPAMFYAQSTVTSLHQAVTGRTLKNETPEYPSMNAALGLLLLAAVVMATWRRAGRDSFAGFLLIAFWSVFGFFTLIDKGQTAGRLDPVSWIWVESTLLPAVILTGARMAGLTGAARAGVWIFAAGVLLYAASGPALGVVHEGVRGVQEAISAVSHALQVMAIDTVVAVRNRPLRMIGLAAAGGLTLGAALGFVWGWMLRSRRTPPRRSP
jgi:4-amino-4-deoxy-L-arabinose transferase-like glycosyltransferase